MDERRIPEYKLLQYFKPFRVGEVYRCRIANISPCDMCCSNPGGGWIFIPLTSASVSLLMDFREHFKEGDEVVVEVTEIKDGRVEGKLAQPVPGAQKKYKVGDQIEGDIEMITRGQIIVSFYNQAAFGVYHAKTELSDEFLQIGRGCKIEAVITAIDKDVFEIAEPVIYRMTTDKNGKPKVIKKIRLDKTAEKKKKNDDEVIKSKPIPTKAVDRLKQ